ncbi:hypothetical protein K493DRAFT_384113 [Basidiobolus meristosporus CBS 931.73]|uniref:Myb-like domain-containing protein n=1 Tax=Basidiobolus meristosporus CBS 931.73 TaxID=1314790 RepID=A0A1Y1YYU4_9FUNG|nr:hypothetical protein K493DRAFT_384113 [Basidiobolus meristosporus CBS 931.73]|eukprot:ORY03192.1 hypothetical protein K493DRAFT_384113 [Basidiobolus meristosporus CBS 931.73]
MATENLQNAIGVSESFLPNPNEKREPVVLSTLAGNTGPTNRVINAQDIQFSPQLNEVGGDAAKIADRNQPHQSPQFTPMFAFCEKGLGRYEDRARNRETSRPSRKSKLSRSYARSPLKSVARPTREDKNPPSSAMPQECHFAPQMRVVDGKLALDNLSLSVDLHCLSGQQGGVPLDVVDESTSERFINSATYLSKIKSQRWTQSETDLFYEVGIAKWGTDFDLIASMFPHRTRKHIKYKFKKEERVNPARITDAVIRRCSGVGVE